MVDQDAIPAAAILVEPRSTEIPVRRGACGTTRLCEQHEREQAHHLWFVGHELVEEAAEANRLGAEVPAK